MNYSRYADYIAGAVIIAVLILYLDVSVNSPIVFGDEGYYGTAARWMAKNQIIPENFPLFENKIYHERFTTSKPIFFIYETFGYFFGGELLVKILIALPAAVAAALIYLMGKKYFGWPVGLVSSFLFLMIPALITYGVLGYVDALFMMLVVAALHFGMKSFEKNKKKDVLLAGIFTGLAVMTKISGNFLFLFFFLYEIFSDKLRNKRFLVALVVLAFLIASPWILRNFISYGSPCYYSGSFFNDQQCGAKLDVEVPKISELKFEGRVQEVSTEADLFKFGILNYSRFAYGWTLPLLFLFGFAFIALRRSKSDKILILLFISTLPLLLFSTWRAEDTARYMLPMNIPLVLIAAIFAGSFFDNISKKNLLVGVIILVVLSASAFVYGFEKISTMKQVKQFVPGVFDACDWVKKNTTEDSVLFATYASQVRYQCERRLAVARDSEEIMLGNESVSHEHLKLNGINYVYVINGLISQQKLQENYYEPFVKMMENSTKFRNVFDNTNKFGPAGVKIFEVL
ncbi:MAG TPA: glycosyltransferase family 39 protein [archaeon]|nr:glycosyltransferase family 39 protein [archaeon]